MQGEVTEVTQDEVRLNGDKPAIKFDYLVIATGSSYAFPCKLTKILHVDEVKIE